MLFWPGTRVNRLRVEIENALNPDHSLGPRHYISEWRYTSDKINGQVLNGRRAQRQVSLHRQRVTSILLSKVAGRESQNVDLRG